MKMKMKKITPFLWFDNNAEEAMNFYSSIFKHTEIISVSRNNEGLLFTGTFVIEDQQFMVLNGGPLFKFNEAISLFVNCDSQNEIDELWEKLSEGGAKSRCGWLKDKFGLSWQIVPAVLGELLQDKNPAKSKSVMAALMEMDKIDIATLKEAYASA
jgi:predicted 3-demethylubiquinone-9 3-methyltransferase (glyoxalase superfamily)